MPKISVIIPTYNCAEYLPGAIDSVLNQSFRDFEIIIVDDGSIDNTKSVVANYIHSHPDKIKYFYQSNSGVAATRNMGIRESKGDYIAFLDSDDIWLPNKLELQTKALDANPDIALVYSDTEMFDGNITIRKSLCRSNYHPKNSFRWKIFQAPFDDGTIIKGNIFQDLLSGNLIAVSSVMVRKECLDSVRNFDSNFKTVEDFELWLRISERYPVIFINKLTTKYRYRENSVSGDIFLRPFNYSEGNAKVYEKLIKRSPHYYGQLKKTICDEYRAASWGFLSYMQLKKARESALKSLDYQKLQPKLYLYIILSFLPNNIVRTIRNLKFILSKSDAKNLR